MRVLSDKKTVALTKRLMATKPHEPIEVVVETSWKVTPDSSRSRADRTLRRRKNFHDFVEPVIEAVTRSGGRVAAVTWLNGSLHVVVEASAIDDLGKLEAVRLLDVPALITQTD